jgi:Tfp pilus assembly protein PilE
MIKFFRNIRKKLLAEGKTSKYFKYAIGEIVLVVIGILIALQINNWNESRKSKTIEHTYLENIKADLNLNINSLETFITDKKNLLKQVTVFWSSLIKQECLT